MRLLFTVCGRAGSKGIKNKNLKVFCGKYLVYYTISAIDLYLKKHEDVEADLAVSSDSKELLDLVEINGQRSVYRIERDVRLSGDHIGKIEVINDCYNKMIEQTGYEYDIVIDLDITSPLRTVDDIEKVIVRHKETGADVTTTVVPARRNPYFNQVMRTDHGVKKVINSSYTARQQAPDIYDMNASIYAYKPEFLNSGKGVLDGFCEVIEMYDTGILDLDHENDYELMEIIGTYLFDNKEDFKEIRDNISK